MLTIVLTKRRNIIVFYRMKLESSWWRVFFIFIIIFYKSCSCIYSFLWGYKNWKFLLQIKNPTNPKIRIEKEGRGDHKYGEEWTTYVATTPEFDPFPLLASPLCIKHQHFTVPLHDSQAVLHLPKNVISFSPFPKFMFITSKL